MCLWLYPHRIFILLFDPILLLLRPGAFETVGSCVSRYWEMKKLLAPGCESVTIARIMTVLKPYMYGMCSAGAGGGGFIYGIMREPNLHAFVREILEKQEVNMHLDICVFYNIMFVFFTVF